MFIQSFLAVVTVCAFSFSAFAKSTDVVKDLMPGYIAIQEALASDDLATAKSKAQELQALASSSKELSKVKSSLARISHPISG